MAGLMEQAGKLPKREKIRGQDHMLAYITPQEAQSLRRQGGGVAPDGGQIMHRGVPAFFGPDGAGTGPGDSGVSGAAADAGHGSGSAAPGGHGGGGGMGGSGNGSMGGVGIGGVMGGAGIGGSAPAGAGASTGPSNSGISGAAADAGHGGQVGGPPGHGGGMGLGGGPGLGGTSSFAEAIAEAIEETVSSMKSLREAFTFPDNSQTVVDLGPLGKLTEQDVTAGLASAVLGAVTPVPGGMSMMGVTHGIAQLGGNTIAAALGQEPTTAPSSVSNPGLGGVEQVPGAMPPGPEGRWGQPAAGPSSLAENYAEPRFAPPRPRTSDPNRLSPSQRFSPDWYR